MNFVGLTEREERAAGEENLFHIVRRGYRKDAKRLDAEGIGTRRKKKEDEYIGSSSLSRA